MQTAERTVTPQQYSDGWREFINGVIICRRYELLHRLPDGNYVVREPQLEQYDPNTIPVIDAR